MADLEPGSATEPFGVPAMTHGLNDMGQVPFEATLPPPEPRSLPPRADIIALLRDPTAAARFDEKWGPAQSKTILEIFASLQAKAAGDKAASDPSATAGTASQVAPTESTSSESAHAAAAFEAGAVRLRRNAARHIAPPDKTYDVAPGQLPSDVDPNLVGEMPGVFERLRLHGHDSKFRGGAFGSAYLGALKEETAAKNVDKDDEKDKTK